MSNMLDGSGYLNATGEKIRVHFCNGKTIDIVVTGRDYDSDFKLIEITGKRLKQVKRRLPDGREIVEITRPSVVVNVDNVDFIEEIVECIK